MNVYTAIDFPAFLAAAVTSRITHDTTPFQNKPCTRRPPSPPQKPLAKTLPAPQDAKENVPDTKCEQNHRLNYYSYLRWGRDTHLLLHFFSIDPQKKRNTSHYVRCTAADNSWGFISASRAGRANIDSPAAANFHTEKQRRKKPKSNVEGTNPDHRNSTLCLRQPSARREAGMYVCT